MDEGGEGTAMRAEHRSRRYLGETGRLIIPLVKEAEKGGRMGRVIRPVIPEEGEVGHEGAPLLARHGASEQGDDVDGGNAKEDLADDVVRERRGLRLFHLLLRRAM
jgi:hypothetical protein